MKIPDILASDDGRRFPRQALLFAPAAILAVGLTGLNYALRRFVRRSLPPESGSMTVSGLRQPVEILRDKWGVPHIYAQNEEDLFFAQGYVQAQDRLFQMDVNRRVGVGRLSEVVGSAGVPSDRFARICGWTRAAEAQLGRGDNETLTVAAAFAAGVNAFIDQGRLPIEFSLLAFKPEPWQILDSSAWGTVLAWGLSVNWETELLRALLIEEVGPEKAADLTPTYNDDYRAILTETGVDARLATALMDAYQDAATYLPTGAVPAGLGLGSNNWVVSGERTATGRPILANDPHLPPIFPTFWYENHLVGGRYNVTGFTMPGIPGVITGHNEHVAWGITNAFPDVQDLYVERFHPHEPTLYEVEGEWVQAETRTESIRVRGRRPIVEKVRYTRHGPVISDLIPGEERAISLRWASYGRNNHLRAILETNRAANWDQFQEGLRWWGFPSQNVVYADVAGNIGYKMPGMVPRRRKGEGLVPTPGWKNEYEWDGWIPFEEMPTAFNPAEGFIVTANNRVTREDFPYLLTGEWLPDYRARRIRELLLQQKSLSLQDNARFQNDTVSLRASRFLAAALPLLPAGLNGRLAQARDTLMVWDGDMSIDSVAATYYFGWLVHFSRAVLTQAVGAEMAERLLRRGPEEVFSASPFHKISAELAQRWLETDPPDWVGDIRPLLLPALKQTITILEQEYGRNPQKWQWGNLHQVHLHNPVTRVPGLGRLWRPVTLPVGGEAYTVNQAGTTLTFPPDEIMLIASCRLLLDVGDWDNSLSVLPGGQSAHLASPHYQDGVDDWHNGRYHPALFTRLRIESVAKGSLKLLPAD